MVVPVALDLNRPEVLGWNLDPHAILLVILGHVLFHVLRMQLEHASGIRLISGLSIVATIWLGWAALPVLMFTLLLIYLLNGQTDWHWEKVGTDLFGAVMVLVLLDTVRGTIPIERYALEDLVNPWFYLVLLAAIAMYFGVRILARRFLAIPHGDPNTLDITMLFSPVILLTFRSSYLNSYLLMGVMIGLYLLVHLQFRIRRTETALRTEKMRILQARVVTSALESERTRIAREIHDGPLQEIIAAKRMLEANQPQRAAKILTDAVGHLRSAIYEMHPSVLQLGLERALQSLTQRVQPLEVQFDFPEQFPELSEEQQSAIYRVVGEAITNASKHARASCVQVSLQVQAQRLQITVADDGIGFNRNKINAGLGLITMRERVESLGGQCDVRSGPRGTQVILILPVDAPALDLDI
ncbi:sensor histidine kinase [Deinococcus misasensis]|uniref:sensor histidine kinase n=1 Tax=Deinococcus misasensis TaxID=392413 RepID=UPI000554C763|nr:sensor histidine kinase [Deinococcus misasensis]